MTTSLFQAEDKDDLLERGGVEECGQHDDNAREQDHALTVVRITILNDVCEVSILRDDH